MLTIPEWAHPERILRPLPRRFITRMCHLQWSLISPPHLPGNKLLGNLFRSPSAGGFHKEEDIASRHGQGCSGFRERHLRLLYLLSRQGRHIHLKVFCDFEVARSSKDNRDEPRRGPLLRNCCRQRLKASRMIHMAVRDGNRLQGRQICSLSGQTQKNHVRKEWTS